MFTPVAGNVAAPKSASFINGDEPIDMAFFEGLRARDPTTQGVIGALIHLISVAINGAGGLSTNCRSMMDSTIKARFDTWYVAGAATPPVDLDVVRTLSLNNGPSCAQWMCDLVNAAKKKDLTAENVEGYFASLGASAVKGGAIASFINSAATFLPDSITTEAFRIALTDNKWSSYHVSRVSTGHVLKPMIQVFKNLNIIIENDGVEAAITTCAEQSYDVSTSDPIPDKIIGYGHIYLEVTGRSIAKWHQGQRCADALPNSKVQAIKAIFKKYGEVSNNLKDIDKAETVDAINTAVPNGFW